MTDDDPRSIITKMNETLWKIIDGNLPLAIKGDSTSAEVVFKALDRQARILDL